MGKKVRIKAPATLSNLNCGFDVLGMAIDNPFDIIELELIEKRTVEITDITGCDGLSKDPSKNVVGVVLNAIISSTDKNIGFRVKIEKGINPGSGIGSSAASSAGAACGANILLGDIFSETEMVKFAMEGERLASGSAHADNVAPAIMGGITLVRSYEPLDIIKINIPKELWCVVLHPGLEVKTLEARKVLDKEIALATAVKQWGNVGGLIAGFYREDYDLISRSLEDFIVEPKRAAFIPGLYDLKKAAVETGALGAGISGSGPSVFALCRGEETAIRVSDAMSRFMRSTGYTFDTYVSRVSPEGASECL